jgi:hypothetical protein
VGPDRRRRVLQQAQEVGLPKRVGLGENVQQVGAHGRLASERVTLELGPRSEHKIRSALEMQSSFAPLRRDDDSASDEMPTRLARRIAL